MSGSVFDEADWRAVDLARALAMDAVQSVGSGHPGTAMSLAPAAYLLFQKLMRHDPSAPTWPGRDRFVLSCGHSSLTLYIQLVLAGYPLTLDDLKGYRRAGSLTPAHPEHGHTAGVETTTGPLGQGVANAVGMAMAARRERDLFDPEAAAGTSPFDHTIWVIASDGDLEEGVSAEASSLAGTQKLGNLVVLWDDNHISIEGDTALAFTEDVLGRYAAYGWATDRVDDANDVDALAAALTRAQADTSRPSIIAMRSIIAYPAPHAQNTAGAHGSALGADEVAATKLALGLDPEVSFFLPDDVLAHTTACAARGRAAHAAWNVTAKAWEAAHPDRAAELRRMTARELPDGWQRLLPTFEAGSSVATRVASGKVLAALGQALPELWGGSADLAGSNNTSIPGAPSFLPGVAGGRTVHFGIREHAMGSVMNGIALHGPTRPYGGTFLVFSDYMRPAVRMAALMRLPVVYVWTHDSIGLGEDGPTHQPIEHVAALRAIPGLDVVRPADATETAHAWAELLRRCARPTALALSRQNLPVFDRSVLGDAAGVARGGYVLADSPGTPEVILIATGSEVAIALEAHDQLTADGVACRVVSMPCVEWFAEQDADYREQVLPTAVRARVSVEAGIGLGWRDLVGDAGEIISIEHFGASADYQTLYREYGVTSDAVAAAARRSLEAAR